MIFRAKRMNKTFHSSGLCHWFLYSWASWRIFDQTSYWRRCYRAFGHIKLNGFCGEFSLWYFIGVWIGGRGTLPETNIAGWKIHHCDGIYQDFDGDFQGQTVSFRKGILYIPMKCWSFVVEKERINIHLHVGFNWCCDWTFPRAPPQCIR